MTPTKLFVICVLLAAVTAAALVVLVPLWFGGGSRPGLTVYAVLAFGDSSLRSRRAAMAATLDWFPGMRPLPA